MPKRYVRRLHPTRGNPPRKMGLRLMLVALVLVAVLIILLRVAEFSNHGVHRPRRETPPTMPAR